MLQLSSQMSDSREKEAPASASGFHALGPGPGTDVIPPEQLSLCLNICPWPESYAVCLLRRASIRCRFEMGLLPILLSLLVPALLATVFLPKTLRFAAELVGQHLRRSSRSTLR